jgi:hypothetical protein
MMGLCITGSQLTLVTGAKSLLPSVELSRWVTNHPRNTPDHQTLSIHAETKGASHILLQSQAPTFSFPSSQIQQTQNAEEKPHEK